jgi:hypothetical protein
VVLLLLIAAISTGFGFLSSDRLAPFFGISATCGCLFLLSVLAAYFNTPENCYYAKSLLPAIYIDPSDGKVKQAGGHLYLELLAFCILVVWGVICTLFLTPHWIGIVVQSLGMIVFAIRALHISQSSSFRFASSLMLIDAPLRYKFLKRFAYDFFSLYPWLTSFLCCRCVRAAEKIDLSELKTSELLASKFAHKANPTQVCLGAAQLLSTLIIFFYFFFFRRL